MCLRESRSPLLSLTWEQLGAAGPRSPAWDESGYRGQRSVVCRRRWAPVASRVPVCRAVGVADIDCPGGHTTLSHCCTHRLWAWVAGGAWSTGPVPSTRCGHSLQVFSQIRNEHFSSVFGFLSQKSRNLQAQYDVSITGVWAPAGFLHTMSPPPRSASRSGAAAWTSSR